MTQLDQYFYGHGKILLTGEYFVMDGALALGLPATVGQSMKVKSRHSYQPVLEWKSYDHLQQKWFEARYEFWHFNIINHNNLEVAEFLQKILREARKSNVHFLRDDLDVIVETKLEFPIEWGLGSSSTLIYNIAQWAYIGPFELQKKTLGGSGYDIACAQSMGPILYELQDLNPYWKPIEYEPVFMDKLFLVYQGHKMDTRKGIAHYALAPEINRREVAKELSQLTKELIGLKELSSFEKVIKEHELIISKNLNLDRVKNTLFSDYWGEIKSLGAWGGDFILVTSDRTYQETREYFVNKGLDTIIPYKELIRLSPKDRN